MLLHLLLNVTLPHCRPSSVAVYRTRRLAVPLGVCAVVGVGGLALHGGLSLLSRAHRATCDSLLEAQIVLADGSVVGGSSSCLNTAQLTAASRGPSCLLPTRCTAC